MPCELEDLMMSSTAKLSSCCVLVATCPELVFSCSIVVKRVLEAVLDHNNFLVVPLITKGVVLVKLPNKSDAAYLHHHVYEWKDHSVRFSKVDKMVMVHVCRHLTRSPWPSQLCGVHPIGRWQEIVCRV